MCVRVRVCVCGRARARVLGLRHFVSYQLSIEFSWVPIIVDLLQMLSPIIFVICQSMSWQLLNQPCVAGKGVISLSRRQRGGLHKCYNSDTIAGYEVLVRDAVT